MDLRKGTTFENADLTGADLSNSILDGSNFTGTKFDQTTKWPENFIPKEVK
jgi:uncharacterized protein YjbI with pentapeptide repeats